MQAPLQRTGIWSGALFREEEDAAARYIAFNIDQVNRLNSSDSSATSEGGGQGGDSAFRNYHAMGG